MLECVKATGKSWQSRINEVLVKYIEKKLFNHYQITRV
ncbi:BrnA antitoxin family protein [Gallibacterium genomosp. 3]